MHSFQFGIQWALGVGNVSKFKSQGQNKLQLNLTLSFSYIWAFNLSTMNDIELLQDADSLVQDCSISNAAAMEMLQCFIKHPYTIVIHFVRLLILF